MEWFPQGGPSYIDNLALLCERCPHLVRDDDWQLHEHEGLFRLRPPPAVIPARPQRDAPPQCTRHQRSRRNPILRT